MLFHKLLQESSSYRDLIYQLPPPIYREEGAFQRMPDKSGEIADKSGLYKISGLPDSIVNLL